MADFVKYVLEDGSEVYFETGERSLTRPRGGRPEVVDEGELGKRVEPIATAAHEVARSLRSRLAPEEIALEFGVKVSGEMNWWFFSKTAGEATFNVTLKWTAGGGGD